MTSEPNAIEVSPSTASLIEPAADIQALKDHWQKIQELKKSILDKSDVQEIGNKVYVKRSGWRKLESAFMISDRIISKEREELPDGGFLWRVESEAFHSRTGRSAVGIGTCSSTERKFAHPDHDILAIAHTRSKNRAISDLIGLGEISAEEIEADHPSQESPLSRDTRPSMSEAERLAREKARQMGQSNR